MKILAFDASSSVVSIAMVNYDSSSKEDEILYRYHQAHDRRDSASFFHGLQTAILEYGKPDRVVVGLGPGSYNGLRSSIAAAQGLTSSSGIELVGISSALGFEEGSNAHWAIGDARGGQYWLALIQEHRFLHPPFLLTPAELPSYLAAHPSFPIIAATPLPLLSELPHHLIIKSPEAMLLAFVGRKSSPSPYLEPLYLKQAHITPPRSS